MGDRPFLRLPPGYRLNEVTDPDVSKLRRPDGSVVAVFSAGGADPEEIERAAWEDHRGGEEGYAPGDRPRA